MPRVNLDSMVWTDPRVKRLAKLAGMSMPFVVGTLAAVWNVAYEAKDPIMRALDVDTAAEVDGFAAMMMAPSVQLAEARDHGAVFLRGVTKRIAYLLTQAERGRLGGLAKAEAKRSDGQFVADAKQPPSTGQAHAYHSGSLPLPPDLPPAPDPDLDPALSPDLGRGAVAQPDNVIPFARTSDDMTGPEPEWWGNPKPKTPPPAKERRKACAMPSGWAPSVHHHALAREQGVDAMAQADQFRDHHAARGSTFKDWDAAFRTWLRNAKRFGGGRSAESAFDIAARIAREEGAV